MKLHLKQNFIQNYTINLNLNIIIISYASGNKPWKNGDEGFERQNFSDGKLEIVGFHTKDFVSITF